MPSLLFLRVYYFIALGAIGAFAPFLAARLEAAGMSGGQLGLLMALLPAGRLLSSPAWALIADRFQAAGLLLRIGSGVSLLAMCLLSPTPLMAAVAVLLYSIGRTPLGPLVDAMLIQTLSAPGHSPLDYGRTRLWGSIGFLTMAWLAGELASRTTGNPLLLAIFLSLLLFLLSFRFPLRGSAGPAPVLPALRALAGDPALKPFLLTCMLQAITLSVYDTFFSVHVQALGLLPSVTGAAVVVGVCAEVGAMRFARPILTRLRPEGALLIAAAVAVVRWALTAYLDDPIPLVAVQVLHGVTFALFWLAGVQWISSRAPSAIAASAQSLFAATTYGLGALIGALIAGTVRASFSPPAIFMAMTIVSTLATIAAIVLIRQPASST